MSDPSTYWLTFTNAALGMVVLICCVAVAIGVIQEIAAKRRKVSAMSKLDREVTDLVNCLPGRPCIPPPRTRRHHGRWRRRTREEREVATMTCPFLKEAQVKYCLTSSVRKLIPIAAAGRADEKCSSAAHATCPVFRMQANQDVRVRACPYLGESLMQYCGAAPVAKMVPYSESVLSRCGNNRYRYCELYLAMANPGDPPPKSDGIPFHDGLQYSANHMWLDVGEDGVCHAGMDAFLSRALGRAGTRQLRLADRAASRHRRRHRQRRRSRRGLPQPVPADQTATSTCAPTLRP